MTTFNNSQLYKNKLVEQMKQHREHDRIIQGKYIQFEKETPKQMQGCFIGCAILSHELQAKHKLGEALYDELRNEKLNINDDTGYSYHGMAEKRTGIPNHFYRLAEKIFEELRDEEAPDFAVAVMEAIPVGLTEDDLKNMFNITEQTEDDRTWLRWMYDQRDLWEDTETSEYEYEFVARRMLETLKGETT